MFDDILKKIMEETEHTKVVQFLEQADTKLKLSSKHDSIQFDYTWLEKIEDAITYIDNIIRKPRKFLQQEEEVVPIERLKKTVPETIRHLATHTNLIQEVDEDDNVTPNKALAVWKEETFDVYENRFVYSLLLNIQYFLHFRKEDGSISGSFAKTSRNIRYDGETSVDDEKIKITVNLSGETFEELDDVNDAGEGVKTRIEKIELVIMDFLKSPICQELKGTPPVKSPIRKTNAILKNPNLIKCLQLWEYIEQFEGATKNKGHDEREEENVEGLKDKMDLSFFMNYNVLNSFTGREQYKEDKLNVFYIRKMVENFMKDNKDVDVKKFKTIVNREFTWQKKKQEKYDKKIINEINTLLRSYDNIKKQCTNLLK